MPSFIQKMKNAKKNNSKKENDKKEDEKKYKKSNHKDPTKIKAKARMMAKT
jgi:hypothetical protein